MTNYSTGTLPEFEASPTATPSAFIFFDATMEDSFFTCSVSGGSTLQTKVILPIASDKNYLTYHYLSSTVGVQRQSLVRRHFSTLNSNNTSFFQSTIFGPVVPQSEVYLF